MEAVKKRLAVTNERVYILSHNANNTKQGAAGISLRQSPSALSR
jgi:hypothetical protein